MADLKDSSLMNSLARRSAGPAGKLAKETPPYYRYAFANPYNLSLLAGAGVAAAAGVQGGKSVVSAGRNLISKDQGNSGGGNPTPSAKPSGDLNPVDEWV